MINQRKMSWQRLRQSVLLLAVLCVVLAFLHGCTKARRPKPNILLIIVDTVRADHLGVHGYKRDTSPAMDAFARENIMFEYATSAAPWTPPAVASIITGLYPASHRMMPPNERDLARRQAVKLNSNLETLTETLKRHGYRTAGYTSNPWTGEVFNYNQGFDDYTFDDRAPANKITDYGIAALERLTSENKHSAPWYLYLHYLDPHDPYKPPSPYDTMFSAEPPDAPIKYTEKMVRNINLYDGEIRFMDDHIGRLFKAMRQRSLYDDTVIIIVGDHGEQFLEHGDHRHGFQLYNEELHVPLLLKMSADGDRGVRVRETVNHIDIYPTLLTLAGIDVPPQYNGIPLFDISRLSKRSGVLSEIRRRYDQRAFVDREGRKIIFKVDFSLETSSWESSTPRWNEQAAVVLGLFDRHKNYTELEPLKDAALGSQLARNFWEHYRALSPAHGASDETETNISDETLDQLRSLGYVE